MERKRRGNRGSEQKRMIFFYWCGYLGVSNTWSLNTVELGVGIEDVVYAWMDLAIKILNIRSR